MASLFAPRELYRRSRADLGEHVEAVGFFLADYLPDAHVFSLREWRPIPASGIESRSDFHVVVSDDTRAEIIKWAWDDGGSLVEAHSHGFSGAQFSPSDLSGLEEWVPHVWWRLRGRPYAALVVDGETLDGLAWIEGADTPQQVTSLDVGGERSIRATGRTVAALARQAERRGRL